MFSWGVGRPHSCCFHFFSFLNSLVCTGSVFRKRFIKSDFGFLMTKGTSPVMEIRCLARWPLIIHPVAGAQPARAPKLSMGVYWWLVDAEEQAALAAEHQIQAWIKHPRCFFNEVSPTGCDDKKFISLPKKLLTSKNDL